MKPKGRGEKGGIALKGVSGGTIRCQQPQREMGIPEKRRFRKEKRYVTNPLSRGVCLAAHTTRRLNFPVTLLMLANARKPIEEKV